LEVSTTVEVEGPKTCGATSVGVTFNHFDAPGTFTVDFQLDAMAPGGTTTLNCADANAPEGYLGTCQIKCPESGGAFEVPTAGPQCICTAGCPRVQRKIFFNNLKEGFGKLHPELGEGVLLARLPQLRFNNTFNYNCSKSRNTPAGYSGSCKYSCDADPPPFTDPFWRLGRWIRDRSELCTCSNY
jgi:hypothetical protein